MRKCDWCGIGIVTARADAHYCSDKHRIYAHRARKRIPSEMLRKPRWIRYSASKVPLTVDGRAASSTDPRTWASHAEATKSRFGVGIGYVLGEGVACIDLDHCLVEGLPTHEAAQYIARYPNNWIEISPSGDGLHIWGTATEGAGTKRSLNGLSIETYSTGRYITITGRTYQAGVLAPLVTDTSTSAPLPDESGRTATGDPHTPALSVGAV